MFKACNVVYFEIGDKVVQRAFVGAPAKVVVMDQDKVSGKYLYTLECDVSNHPDGVDENGERVAVHTTQVWGEQLADLNWKE